MYCSFGVKVIKDYSGYPQNAEFIKTNGKSEPDNDVILSSLLLSPESMKD